VTQTAIPCTVMRGGTSKGLYFRSPDLPADVATRDAVLLAAMGSPDLRQIDGMGGAHPLTSKIAVVGPSTHPEADVDYLFLQCVVDEPRIDAGQNCGNLLAGVGPFAIEEGMFQAADGVTNVRINMLNTQSLAVAAVQTPGGRVRYDGEARIDGVPGTAAPIPIDFLDVAGSSCGALLPTGAARDVVDGIELTAIDNGMPVVVMRAADFGKTGYETPEELEADAELKARVEAIRLQIGPRMNLGDVAKKTVPKMCLVAPAQHGGAICTRNFIPHRVHEAIGVFGAVSVATACVTPGSVAAEVAGIADVEAVRELEVEHPTGFFTVAMDVALEGAQVKVRRSALLRTARRLMRGEVYVPASVWDGSR
jgi:4-oxalomesaconate tautomerase